MALTDEQAQKYFAPNQNVDYGQLASFLKAAGDQVGVGDPVDKRLVESARYLAEDLSQGWDAYYQQHGGVAARRFQSVLSNATQWANNAFKSSGAIEDPRGQAALGLLGSLTGDQRYLDATQGLDWNAILSGPTAPPNPGRQKVLDINAQIASGALSEQQGTAMVNQMFGRGSSGQGASASRGANTLPQLPAQASPQAQSILAMLQSRGISNRQSPIRRKTGESIADYTQRIQASESPEISKAFEGIPAPKDRSPAGLKSYLQSTLNRQDLSPALRGAMADALAILKAS